MRIACTSYGFDGVEVTPLPPVEAPDGAPPVAGVGLGLAAPWPAVADPPCAPPVETVWVGPPVVFLGSLSLVSPNSFNSNLAGESSILGSLSAASVFGFAFPEPPP